MQVFISPAKNLKVKEPKVQVEGKSPLFLEQSEVINQTLKKKSPKKLIELQGISQNLADLNWERNQKWEMHPPKGELTPAALLFNGEVYQGLSAEQWGKSEWEFSEAHLWILSGLYGALRPIHHILPYRLEMGTKLPVSRKTNLYAYWKNALQGYFENLPEDEIILDLASNEYIKVIKQLKLKNRVIKVDFLDEKNGKHKPIQFFVKKARGLMANWIVQHKIEKPEQLKGFDVDGYYFSEVHSSDDKIVFLRDEK